MPYYIFSVFKPTNALFIFAFCSIHPTYVSAVTRPSSGVHRKVHFTVKWIEQNTKIKSAFVGLKKLKITEHAI
jgi:hypothetical protein